MSDYLELLPAVDIKGGQAVQLVQGVDGSEKRFGDPIEAALRWQDAGAEWIHLVDLDAAFGHGNNRALQAEIVGKLDIQVEMSGGIRDDESLEAAMATGCRRVNIGTAALEQPEWCARAIATYGDRVAVGLDVRGRTLAARGWTQEGGDLYETLARLDARGLRPLRRHRRQQGRHAAGPQPPAAARRLRGHRPPGRGLGRRDDPRRHPRADGPGADRRRGRDRRHRPLHRAVHPRGRPRADPAGRPRAGR